MYEIRHQDGKTFEKRLVPDLEEAAKIMRSRQMPGLGERLVVWEGSIITPPVLPTKEVWVRIDKEQPTPQDAS